METTYRASQDRGRTRLDWLDSRHSFSFGGFHQPGWDGFRGLRVLNEDVVAPGRGFGPHPHRDAEILSFVLTGALLHVDSTGARSRVAGGEIQQMTAGSGVVHAEWNASEVEAVRFIQVWLHPDCPGISPGFALGAPRWREQKGRVLVASHDGREASLPIHADASIYAGRLDRGDGFVQPLAAGRGAWVQVMSGGVEAAGRRLDAGDGLGVESAHELEITAGEDAELLLFDLA